VPVAFTLSVNYTLANWRLIVSLQRCYLRSFIATFLLSLLAGVPLAAQAPAPEPPKSRPGKVSGRVLRADTERPLAKATVTTTVEGRPQENLSVRTNSAGVFEFPEVSPGRYRLRAQRNGFVPQVYGARGGGPGIPLSVESGQRVEKIDFRLEPAGVIAGNIRDEDNEPVEGIEVRALRMRFSPGGQQETSAARSLRTDDLGNYRLSGLAPGMYYVQAGGLGQMMTIDFQNPTSSWSPTYYPRGSLLEEAQRVQVSAGSETRGADISVTPVPTFTISGLVADPSPGPGPRNYSAGFTRGSGTIFFSVERSNNSFRLPALPPGEYMLMVSSWSQGKMVGSGYRTVRLVDSDLRVVVELGRAAELAGELRATDGQALSFANLSLRLVPDAPEAFLSTAQVEDSGKIRIPNVPEGRYWIRLQGRESELYLKEARCAGDDYTSEQITLAAAQVVENCTVVVSRDVGEVNGTVTRDTKPISGQVVVLIPVEKERRRNPRHAATAQSDVNGNFVLRGVIPGDYFAFAVAPSDDNSYYDLDFPERNLERATRLTVKPSEHHLLNLTPIRPQ